MKLLWVLPLLLYAAGAQAFTFGDWHLDGHVYAGSNSVQNTYIGFGADLYTYIEDHLATGVGAYYTTGTSNGSNDREIGAGPFVSYTYPILDFLIPSIREDIDYVDERDPLQLTDSSGNVINTYQSYYGMASITTVQLHLFFTPNFGVGVGYRLALALNNSNLEKDHSGLIFGLAFGF